MIRINYTDVVSAVLSHKDSNTSIEFILGKNESKITDFRTFISEAYATGQQMTDQGVHPGDELVIITDDITFFARYFVAAMLFAIIPVPLSFPATASSRKKVLAVWKQLRQPWIVCDQPVDHVFGKYADKCPESLFSRTLSATEVNTDRPVPADMIKIPQPESLAFIQYSSGSTGDPKGVKVTHEMLITDCELAIRLHQISRQDSFLSWMPLSHDFGVIYFLLFPLICGLRFTLIPTKIFARNPVLWLEQISRSKATISGAPNYAFEHVMKMFRPDAAENWDLSSVRYIINGAEPINAGICRRFEQTFMPFGLSSGVIIPCYGLAEATLLVSSATLGEQPVTYHCDRDFLKPGDMVRYQEGGCEFVDVGYTDPHVQVRIADENNQLVESQKIGRIQLQGKIVTPGYYVAPNRTEELFTTDGWLDTGDLGFLHEGRLIITGRSKDIIIINGKNYYPQDIEAICSELPELGLNKVVAVSPQDRSGKSLFVVFLLFRHKAETFLPLLRKTEELLIRELGIKPDHCLPVKHIPKTTSGKLKRFDLVQQYEQGKFDPVIRQLKEMESSAGVHPMKWAILSGDQTEIIHQLKILIQPLCPQHTVDSQQPLMEQGLQSIHLTEIVSRISAASGHPYPIGLMFDCPTLEALAATLADQKKPLPEAPTPAPVAGSQSNAALIGMGCYLPGDVTGPDDFWQLMMAEKDLVSEMPADRQIAGTEHLAQYPGLNKGHFIRDPWCFDHPFFNITPAEALSMDPQQRLLLQCCWHAFENAGIDPHQWRGKKVGVYLGLSNTDYDHLLQRSADPQALSAYRLTGNSSCIAAGRIAYCFHFTGPVITIDTACSSSLVAIHYALQDLRSGACELAVVAGVNLMLDDSTSAALTCMQALSPSGQSKTFSAGADGYGRGEGCAVILLRRAHEAEMAGNSIHAIIAGSAMNHDGASNGLTAPNGKAQQDVLQQALNDAGCQPQDVVFIETHGTGTVLGDPIEVNAISQVYSDQGQRTFPLYLGSVKTNIGHLEAAAGIAGVIKATLALEHQQLPASLHCGDLNPHIDWSVVPARIAIRSQQLPPGICYAGVSAFGLSGTNCHVMLKNYPVTKEFPDAASLDRQTTGFRLPLSAASPESLAALQTQWRELIDRVDEQTLEACCIANAVRRAHLPFRAYFYGADKPDLQQQLDNFSPETLHFHREKPALAFIFTGQGCQYPSMGTRLYEYYPEFRTCIDDLAEVLQPVWPYNLVDCITHAGISQQQLNDTAVTQVIVVAFQIALAKLWQSLGITPTYCIGHSIGEIAAAVVCESLSAKDAILLAAARGRLIASLPSGGAMAAVMADCQTVQAVLDRLDDGEQLVIAAHNSPESVTVSGKACLLEQALEQLTTSGIRTRKLDISHAFHSPLLQPVISDFAAIVGKISFTPAKYTVISTVTGETLQPDEWHKPEYWVEHLTHPVLFQEALQNLPQDNTLILEISPKPTLMVPGKQCCPQIDWIYSQHPQAVTAPLDQAIAALYQAGINVNWSQLSGPDIAGALPLPLYPFQAYQHHPDSQSIPTETQQPDYAEQPSETSFTPQSGSTVDVKEQVSTLIASVTGLTAERLDPDATWFALGLDSLVIVQVQQAVIRNFGIEFELSSLMGEVDTCNKLADKLAELLPAEKQCSPVQDAPIQRKTMTQQTPDKPEAVASDPLASLCQQQMRAMNQLFETQLAALSGHTPDTQLSSEQHHIQRQPVSVKTDRHRPVTEIKGLYQALKTEKDQSLTKRQLAHLQWLQQQLNQKTAGSKEYTATYRPYYANSRSIIGFKPETKELTYPVHVNQARGIYLWDIDGNRYIDITMGFGSILFGHNPDFIKDAITETLSQGAPVGPQNLQAATAAEKLCRLTGNERASFFTSGTEAIMVAVRIARSVTKRNKIVIFHGAFHGSFDSVLASGWLEDGQPQTVPLTDGSPQGLVDDTIVLTYGDKRSLDVICEHAETIAAVIIEPVQSRNPALQPVAFVRELRQLTQSRDIALICDDIILGCRYAVDGSRSWLGITPDLVTYGKVVGGGQPIGVLAGQRKYMDAVDGGNWRYGDDSVPQSRTAFVAGTFNSHPIAMSAANAVLDKLLAEGEALLAALNQRTEAMCRQLNEWFETNQIPVHMVWFGSLFRFEYSAQTELLNFHLLKNGLYVWEGRNCFLGCAHTDEDIREIIRIIKQSTWELIHGGWTEGLTCENQSVMLPLTDGQQAMLFLLSSQPDNATAYTEMMVLEFDHELDPLRLQQAWSQVLDRHDALRVCRFTSNGQYVAATVKPLIPVKRVSAEQRLEARSQLLNQPFDTQYGPFWRIQVILTPNECDLLLCFSHLIVDGWSMGIVADELATIYQALGADQRPTLEPVIPLMQLLAKDAVKTDESQLSLSGIEPDYLYPLYIAGDNQLYAPATGEGTRIQSTFSQVLFSQVRAFAQQLQVSPFSILMGAWAILLNRLTARARFVIGMPVAGHNEMGAGHLVGYASEVRGVLIDISPTLTAGKWIRQLTGRIHEARQNQTASQIPVSCLFNVDRGISLSAGSKPRWGLVPVSRVKHPLFLNILEFNDQLYVDFDIDTAIATTATGQCWLSHYMTIVQQLCRDEELSLEQLMIAIDPYQGALTDGQGIPLFTGAIGTHQQQDKQAFARLLPNGRLQTLAPAEATFTWRGYPFLTKAITTLLAVPEDGVRVEIWQDHPALLIEDPQHPLASVSLPVLANKIQQCIAPLWQPVYINRPDSSGYVPIYQQKPATSEPEIAMARIWAQTLGLKDLPPVNLSFIQLGGNSLAALNVIHKMQSQLRLSVSLSAFLQASGIEMLIKQTESAGEQASGPDIKPLHHHGSDRITCANNQQRLLFLQTLEPQLYAYHVGFSISFSEQIETSLLEQTLQSLMAANPVLHCCFPQPETAILVDIDPRELISCVFLETAEKIVEDAQLEVERPFNLETQPGWRIRLQQQAERSTLVITMHHVICDLWSVELFCHELVGTLQQVQFGYQLPVTYPALSYHDYAVAMNDYQLSDSYNQDLEAYLQKLQPLPQPVDLHPDKPCTQSGSLAGESEFHALSEALSQQLYQLSVQRGYSLYAITAAALALLIHQQQGAQQMIIGVVSAQREYEGLDKVQGFFANTVPVRVELTTGMTTDTFIRTCADQITLMMRYGYLTLDTIIEKLNISRHADRQSLLDVVLVMDDRATLNHIAQSHHIEFQEIPVRQHQFDFTLYVSYSRRGIDLHALYNSGLYSRQKVSCLLLALEHILEHMVKQTDDLLPMNPHYELTAQQKRLWFVDAFENGYLYEASPVYYNMPCQIKLDAASIDPERLQMALNQVVSQQVLAGYRLSEQTQNSDVRWAPSQRQPLSLTVCDCQPDELMSRLEAFNFAPFNLSTDILLRAVLIRCSDGNAVFQITAHHIIADQSALRRFISAIFSCYEHGKGSRNADEMTHAAIQACFTPQQLPEATQSLQLNYWKQQLAHIRPLQLPEDIPRQAIHFYQGEQQTTTLTGLGQLAGLLACSQEAVALTLLHELLHRYSRQDDIVTGMVITTDRKMPDGQYLRADDNLVVIRSAHDPQRYLADQTHLLEATIRDARHHGDVPFDEVVLAVNPDNDMSRTALFDVLFVFEQPSQLTDRQTLVNAQGWGKYDVVFCLTAADEITDISQMAVCFNATIYHQQTIRQMITQFKTLVCSAIELNTGLCHELRLLTDEAAQKLVTQSCQFSGYDDTQTIISAIASITDQYPQYPALDDGYSQLTYAQLDKLTNQLATVLIAQGIQRENVVAIYMERGLLQSLVILAILKSGGAYLALDKKHPPARLRAIAEDAAACLLITSDDDDAVVCPAGVHVLCTALSGLNLCVNGQIAGEVSAIQLPVIEPGQLAYLIYTSGSTGNPKGVQVEHRHVVQLIHPQENPFDFTAGARWSLYHSYAFDFSVWETFGAWMTGGTLYAVPPEAVMDSRQFLQCLQTHQIGVLSQTPGAFYALLEQLETQKWPELSLQLIVFGGEALQPARLATFRQHYPHVRLINMFGITETTVHVTYKEISDAECQSGQSNIGRPLPNYGILLIDDDLSPCAPGVPGEMMITGYGVTRGYLNRPELNKISFIEQPGINGKAFRSGDLARYTPEGDLIYLGRKDTQVQLRGFRIEPGEIEQVLLTYPGIRNATVLLITDEVAQGISGDDAAIMAWLVPEAGQKDFSYEQLLSWLGDRLPEYMIPSRFFIVGDIPLNHNGKVDKNALMIHQEHPIKSLAADRIDRDEIDSVTDRELRQIWCEVLGIAHISHDDNFFEIGGHSLKANSALLRIRERLCPSMTLKDFFSHPHFLVQASYIDHLIAGEQAAIFPELLPLNAGEPWVPSFSQQRLWLTQQQHPQDTSYNSVGLFSLTRTQQTPDFDVIFDALDDAFRKIITRHHVLRCNYVFQEGTLNIILRSHTDGVLKKIIASDAELNALKQQELNHVFDLENDGLIRAFLIQPETTSKQHVGSLLVNMHHIVSDGASVVVLMNELSAFYQHYFDHQIPLPAPLPIQYQDFAAWQQQLHRSGVLDRQISYWQQIFADGIPQLNLPIDHPRHPHPDHLGDMHICHLGPRLSQSLRQLAQQQHCTLFMMLSTVTQLMLYRYSRQGDMVLGTPVVGRDHVALEPLIGFFLNVLPLRLQCNEKQSFFRLLEHNRHTITEAFANQQLAFDQLAEAIGYQKQPGRHALFDVQIILQNNPQLQLDFGHTSLVMHQEETVSAKFDLNIMFSDEDDIELQLEYATALFERSTTEAMMADIIAIADTITKQQGTQAALTVGEILASCQVNDVLQPAHGMTASQADASLIHNRIEEEDW